MPPAQGNPGSATVKVRSHDRMRLGGDCHKELELMSQMQTHFFEVFVNNTTMINLTYLSSLCSNLEKITSFVWEILVF